MDLDGVDDPADDDDACAHDYHRHHHGDGERVHQGGRRYHDGGADAGGNDVEDFNGKPELPPRDHLVRLEPVPPEYEGDGEADEIPPDRAVDEELDFFHAREAELGGTRKVLHG